MVTAGPLYAIENNSAFTSIDSHNHTSGQGLQIPSAGISLNADLPFNSYNATLLRTSRFSSQSIALSLASDIGCAYSVLGNLFWNDGSGNQIQLTAGGALNAASIGAITGLGGTTGSASYSSVSAAFTFNSNTNQAAQINVGPVSIAGTTASANSCTLRVSNSLSANYTLNLPSGLPASTKIMTCDNSGNIGVVYDVDNSTLAITSNVIAVKANGITASQIANNTITATQIANNTITATQIASATITGTQIAASTVTNSNLVAVNVVVSGSTNVNVVHPAGAYVQVNSVTITTSGRRVRVYLQPDGTVQSASIQIGNLTGGTTNVSTSIRFLVGPTFAGAVCIAQYSYLTPNIVNNDVFPLPVNHFIEYTPTAGTYTFYVACLVAANTTVTFTYSVIGVEEI